VFWGKDNSTQVADLDRLSHIAAIDRNSGLQVLEAARTQGARHQGACGQAGGAAQQLAASPENDKAPEVVRHHIGVPPHAPVTIWLCLSVANRQAGGVAWEISDNN